MKWLLIVGGAVIAIAAVVMIVGAALPKQHLASKSASFAATPEAVFAAITDIERFPAWRKSVKTVRRLPDRDGRAVWVEDGTNGPITLAVDRSEPPRVLVTRIADENLPFGGTWTYEIAPAAEGSVLTITENGEIYNPLFRFMARFVFGYEATMTDYLQSLSTQFGDGQNAALRR